MCDLHYKRWKTHGDPRIRTTTGKRYDVEWARLDELKPGDLLIQPRAMDVEAEIEPTLPDGTPVDADVAWLIGAAVGDGTVTDNSLRLCLYGDKRDRATRIIRERWKCNPSHGESFGLIASNVQLAVALAGLGMRRNGPDKRVPDAVWTWSRELRKAFLDGYCDADGHYPANQAKHGERTYSSASRELIEDARALHIMAGDPVSNISTNRRVKPIFIKGKEVKNARPLHSFTVWCNTGRGESVLRAHSLGRSAFLDGGDFTLAKVLSITDEGVQDTYDLEVEDAHNFIADGIVVHNSGLASALVNVAKGRSPYSRLFTTFSFTGGGTGPQGFIRNLPAGLRVGVTNAGVGHMASTVAGVSVESSGSAGVRVGGGARGAGDGLFTMRYGLKGYDQGGVLPPGVTTAYNGTGQNEYVFTQQQIQAGYASNGGGFGSISTAFRPGGAVGDLAGAAADLKDAAMALKDIVSLRDGLDKLTGSIFGQEKALSGYESAWDSATASIKANGKTLNITTEKGRANRSALLGIAEAAQDVVTAMDERGQSAASIAKKMAEMRAEFIRMARAMGLTSAKAKALADRYGLVPSKVEKIVKAEKAATAYNKKADAFNKTIEAKAGGGAASGWTLLGEDGPELAWMPSGSHVVPSARTRAMLAAGQRRAIPTGSAGAGGGPMHVTLMVGERTLTELVVDTARGYVRTHGGDVQAVLGVRRR